MKTRFMIMVSAVVLGLALSACSKEKTYEEVNIPIKINNSAYEYYDNGYYDFLIFENTTEIISFFDDLKFTTDADFFEKLEYLNDISFFEKNKLCLYITQCGTSDLISMKSKMSNDVLQIYYVNDFDGDIETDGRQIKMLFNKIEKNFLEKFSSVELIDVE
ncbi:hypothetical protein LJC17_05230 [Acholeplasma sp. OttesenSCG-928-E16]|nr:hypothetical protein [Acholeplasma sp. OttesenSCG-928-E16]